MSELRPIYYGKRRDGTPRRESSRAAAVPVAVADAFRPCLDRSRSRMNAKFFEQPVLNSPYEAPGRHWKLDESGQPTHEIVARRRAADFVTPVPKARRAGRGAVASYLLDLQH